jgi:hypothetical protein
MAQGLDPFEWKTSVLYVSMHIAKYNLNTVNNTLLHETHQYTAQGLHHFGSKTSMPHVSMHTTYNINSGTSVNFIQEYVNIIYIYRCPYLFLTFYM